MKKLVYILTLTSIWFLTWPMSSQAQKVYHVSALVADDLFVAAFDAFKIKMTEIGYIEGKNIQYDLNNAKGDRSKLGPMAKKIVDSKPDLIVTSSTTATLPIAKLTEGSNLPVIFLSSANPLALVKSYASSGNNLTGVSDSTLDIIGKQMELVKDLSPKAKRVISISVSGETNYRQVRNQTQEAAERLGLTIVEILVDNPEDAKSKLTDLVNRRAGDMVFSYLNLSMLPMRDEIIKIATAGRIPVIGSSVEAVRKGALATYSSDFYTLGVQSAALADKIFKGARPSDLPIDQPSKLKLVINLKAARKLGLEIPKRILVRADEIYE